MTGGVPFPRRVSTLFAAVALVGGLTYPVSGQTETVELRVKYEKGETLYYRHVSAQEAYAPLPWTNLSARTAAEGRWALRVLDVDPDGTMTVESVMEDLRVTTTRGRVEDRVDQPDMFKILPNGEIVEVQGSQALSTAAEFAIVFPSRPLTVGDTWGATFDRHQLGATEELKTAYTLAGVDRTDSGRAARIRTRFEGTVKTVELPRHLEEQIRVTGTTRGSGEQIWSVERGRILRQTSEETLDLHYTETKGRKTLSFHVRVHLTGQFAPLPQDRVVVAAVGPDSLIAPGKAVGGFALGPRMEDLVGRLGSPSTAVSAPDPTMWGADRGFRPSAASWPSGLVAYVDSEDRSALLGLAVADRRFRTDKGLGLGSSRGAVLFAHGTSPIRVAMRSCSGVSDGVLVLIYNDEGIAYGITAEGQPSMAAARWSRAPLGVVRWVVVFPPGSAGKVFPLT